MTVRIASYLTLRYQDLIEQKQLTANGRLPPVLPIVLYNGEARWDAAGDLSDCRTSTIFTRCMPCYMHSRLKTLW